jgi:hypothetical protein
MPPTEPVGRFPGPHSPARLRSGHVADQAPEGAARERAAIRRQRGRSRARGLPSVQPTVVRSRRVLSLLRAPSLADPPANEEDWCLNVVWLDRRKCPLPPRAVRSSPFHHDGAPPTCGARGPCWFRLSRPSHAEQLPPNILGPLNPETVVLAMRASRSGFGFTNDLALSGTSLLAVILSSRTRGGRPSPLETTQAVNLQDF